MWTAWNPHTASTASKLFSSVSFNVASLVGDVVLIRLAAGDVVSLSAIVGVVEYYTLRGEGKLGDRHIKREGGAS